MTDTDSAARKSRLDQIEAAMSSKLEQIGWGTALFIALGAWLMFR